jgi:hypothetical protein
MDFTRRKLPKEAATQLRKNPIASVKPYALMLAPVYVFMRINEKFVSVKAPLDFFTPQEIDRLKSFESFFLPEFVDIALPFREVARSVRGLITWAPQIKGEDQLPPAPYEISDSVLRLIGPLWGPGAVIEPFFAAVFVNELCDLLPEDRLREARDRNVATFELAVLRSSWAVFLALHLGYCDFEFLNALRLRVFDTTSAGATLPSVGRGSEVDELLEIVGQSLTESALAPVRGDIFSATATRASQKMVSRLERIRAKLIRADEPAATIYGAAGFAGEGGDG